MPNYPVIALERLGNEERIKTGCSHRAVVDYTDLTDTAGTSKVLTLKTLPAGAIVNAAFFDIVKPFSGGTISALTAKLGVTGSDATLKANASIFTGAVSDGAFAGIYSAAAAIALLLTFTSTTDNLSSLTQGKLFVYFNEINVKDASLAPLSAP